jgi:arginine-tRNA-protein transferase
MILLVGLNRLLYSHRLQIGKWIVARLNDISPVAIQFYATAAYACSYLDNRLARSQVATPPHFISGDIYSELIKCGFRRSGDFTYRPYCDECAACVPLRVCVQEFFPNRSQRRAIDLHQGLTSQIGDLRFLQEHYDLYQRYQEARHTGGGMDQDSREQFEQFLLQSHVDTKLVEFRDANNVLKMVSVIDILKDGYSSVYTFYEPEKSASFGTYNILWQIEQVKKAGLSYLYLGYWIKESHKMAYKSNFRPYEIYLNNKWIKYEEL